MKKKLMEEPSGAFEGGGGGVEVDASVLEEEGAGREKVFPNMEPEPEAVGG